MADVTFHLKDGLKKGETFELLANDSSVNVRHCVGYNRKTPLDILRQLAADAGERVAEPAKKRLTELLAKESERTEDD